MLAIVYSLILSAALATSTYVITNNNNNNQEQKKQQQQKQQQQQPNKHSFTCDHSDTKSPCACQTIMTDTRTVADSKLVDIQFPEYVCRSQDGFEPADWYRCTQIWSATNVCNDVQGRRINVPIVFRSGCELRCVDKGCGLEDDEQHSYHNQHHQLRSETQLENQHRHYSNHNQSNHRNHNHSHGEKQLDNLDNHHQGKTSNEKLWCRLLRKFGVQNSILCRKRKSLIESAN